MSSVANAEASELIDNQSNNDDNASSDNISSELIIKTEETSSQSQNDEANNDSNNNMYDDTEEVDNDDNNTTADNNTSVVETKPSGTSNNDNTSNDNNDTIDHENDNEKTNLIVNYLPQQMTDEQFEELFKKFGPMKSCKIVRNRSTGLSYGFGFVDFETNEQALKAIDELNGHELETKKIKVAFARPAGQDIKQANLYIKNVPNTWTQDDVRRLFEPYGNIIQVRVLGNNRGVAFVLYDLRKQAEDALEAMNGKQVEGCDGPLEIKFAADKKSSEKGNKDSSNNNRRDRGNNNRGSRNRSNNNNNNNNGRDSNRMGSMDRRKQMDGRGRGGGGRNNSQYNNSNNQSQYNNSSSNNNNINGVGPVRQQSSTRMARYAPFVPVQAQPPQMAPMAMAAAPYGYHSAAAVAGQQPTMPYMMAAAYQPMMQMNPQAAQMAPMAQMNPRDAYQAPMPMTGYSPMAAAAASVMAPQQQQPQSAMGGGMWQPAGQMQQLASGQSTMNSMRNNHHHHHNTNNNSTSNSSANSADGVTLFVYNIGPDSDETELRSMFAPYGNITKCNVVRKTPGGETKGFGFVTLQTRDQANAAISSLNGSMRNNRVLQVSFKK